MSTDLESRLADALRAGADDDPGTDGLLAGARRRARLRRRRTMAGLAAAAAVVVVGIGLGVPALKGGDEPTPDLDAGVLEPTVGTRDVAVEGVALRVPGDWVRLDMSECDFDVVRFAPPEVDPCDVDAVGAALYGASTFDPVMGPGELSEGDDRVTGYVSAGEDYVVYVSTERYGLTEQVLASAQPGSEPADASRRNSASWRFVRSQGVGWRYPARWDYIDGVCFSSSAASGVRAPDIGPRRTGACWAGQRNVEGTSSLIRVQAPTQAIAQLVLGSGRPIR